MIICTGVVVLLLKCCAAESAMGVNNAATAELTWVGWQLWVDFRAGGKGQVPGAARLGV